VTEAVLARAAWAPDHVPEELLWDHDIRDFVRGHDDPYVALAQLHEGPGIIWARGIARDRPGWAPVSYDCIVDVLQDPATFSSAYATGFSQMMGVDLRLNTRVSADDLLAGGFDEVILATGIVPRTPAIPGVEHIGLPFTTAQMMHSSVISVQSG